MADKEAQTALYKGTVPKPSIHNCGKEQSTQLRPSVHTEKQVTRKRLHPKGAFHATLHT